MDKTDRFEHRRLCLEKLLIDKCDNNRSLLATKIGKPYNYVVRMLYPPGKKGKKNIGEDIAEAINNAFPGWENILDDASNLVLPERKEDANRLMDIFEDRREKHGITQSSLADALGYSSQSSVSQYLIGKIPLNVEAAIKFAEGLHCRVSDFSPSLQKEIDRIARFASSNVAEEESQTDSSNKKKILKPEKTTEHKESVCEAYRLANYETKEVVGLVLSGTNDPLPKWANEEMRKSINAMKYSVIEWRRNEKKSG
ncbi:MAG: helix-turn-helix domain-containing protein [Candidatus Jettenia sp.]|nr:helix-turn-helix domain-containing protein [Candidatus Jettenia sp.]